MDAKNVAAVFTEGASVLQGYRTLKGTRGISEKAIDSIYGVTHELYNSGKYAQALKGFELLCLYDHENPKYWMGLGYCRQVLEDYFGAVSALSYSTLYLDEHDWDLYFNLARCLTICGQKDSAEEYIDAILASDAESGLKDKTRSLQAQLTHTTERTTDGK